MKTNNPFRFLAIIAVAVTVFVSCQKDSLDDKHVPLPLKNLPVLNQTGVLSVNLIAGQTIDAGDIVLSFDTQNLYVEFKTTDGWLLSEAHLWVGSSLSSLPTNNSGNPQIGLFPYKVSNLAGTTSYTFTISLDDLGGYLEVCGNTFYVAAHASVFKMIDNEVVQSETAWGEGSRITPKGSWAMYFGFVFNCETTEEEQSCETAFGFGNTTFIQAGLTNSRWGWIITLDNEGSFSTPIYAGAGQNNISNAAHVGTLNVDYYGGLLNVNYNMFPGYTMSETHLYASATYPSTIAPGQYGNQNTLNNAVSDSYSLQISGGLPFYIIAHAVVCDE
jgi:hypothetical protein